MNAYQLQTEPSTMPMRCYERLAPAIEQATIKGFDIAGYTLAAGHAGGDYFGWLPYTQATWIFTVADVYGHGSAAARLASGFRHHFGTLARRHPSLEQLVVDMNDRLVRELPPGGFVTAAFGELGPRRGHVRLSGVGHGLTYLYRARTPCLERCTATEPPLGILTRTDRCPATAFELLPGDMLVLVTDGFCEWPDGAGRHFGLERLEIAIRRRCHLRPAEVVAGIYDEVRAFANGAQPQDDLTALALRCR